MDIEEMRRIGGMMSNVMFNLAQSGGAGLVSPASLKELQEKWDAAVRATPPSPSTAETLAALEDLSKGAEVAKSVEWVNDRASVVLAALASRPAVEAGELPPLPEPWIRDLSAPEGSRDHFAEDQMRDYGQECIRAALATKPATSAPGAAGDDHAALEVSFRAGIQQTRATLCGQPGASTAGADSSSEAK